jgi:hypothetical protein
MGLLDLLKVVLTIFVLYWVGKLLLFGFLVLLITSGAG